MQAKFVKFFTSCCKPLAARREAAGVGDCLLVGEWEAWWILSAHGKHDCSGQPFSDTTIHPPYGETRKDRGEMPANSEQICINRAPIRMNRRQVSVARRQVHKKLWSDA